MIFVDTWAWIALAVTRDQHHGIAKAQHRVFRKTGRRYATTDYVLSELISYLYCALPSKNVKIYIDSILEKSDRGKLELIHISADQFRRAYALRVRYQDKPDISFVDLTSMVVMQDLGIADVFTGDAHFRQVNLGFQLHP